MKNKNKIIAFGIIAGLLVIPIMAFAITIPGTPQGGKTIQTILDSVLTPVWQVTFAIAVVMFITAGIMFMTAAGDPNMLSRGRQTVIWAVIGLAVAVLAFSIDTVVGFLK